MCASASNNRGALKEGTDTSNVAESGSVVDVDKEKILYTELGGKLDGQGPIQSLIDDYTGMTNNEFLFG